MHNELKGHGDVCFIFVLNQPQRKGEIGPFLEGLKPESWVVTLEDGSAYDLIPAEPTTWIVDREGRILFRHSGFTPGDELFYENELRRLLETTS